MHYYSLYHTLLYSCCKYVIRLSMCTYSWNCGSILCRISMIENVENGIKVQVKVSNELLE